jgi:glutamine amidotransferase
LNSPNVTIIDYGVGNLLSVSRGFEHHGVSVEVTRDPKKILTSQRVVLPGVGAFPNAMQILNKLNLVSVIQELASKGTPLLAICLGMQLIMEESEEFGITQGIGLIPGRVVAIPREGIDGSRQKIPHIGWSSLNISNTNSSWGNTLLQETEPGGAVYFTHSFMAQPSDQRNQLAHAIYGGRKIPAVITKNQITGFQFHPEKSGTVGLKMLARFIAQ